MSSARCSADNLTTEPFADRAIARREAGGSQITWPAFEANDRVTYPHPIAAQLFRRRMGNDDRPGRIREIIAIALPLILGRGELCWLTCRSTR